MTAAKLSYVQGEIKLRCMKQVYYLTQVQHWLPLHNNIDIQYLNQVSYHQIIHLENHMKKSLFKKGNHKNKQTHKERQRINRRNITCTSCSNLFRFLDITKDPIFTTKNILLFIFFLSKHAMIIYERTY